MSEVPAQSVATAHAEIEVDVAADIHKALVRWGKSASIDLERTLWDGTRVDICTDNNAIEVDWAHKWAEAIGQALYYGGEMAKKPTILLLLEDAVKERAYVYRACTVCRKHNIDVWLYDTTEKTLIIDGYGYHIDDKKPTAQVASEV